MCYCFTVIATTCIFSVFCNFSVFSTSLSSLKQMLMNFYFVLLLNNEICLVLKKQIFAILNDIWIQINLIRLRNAVQLSGFPFLN